LFSFLFSPGRRLRGYPLLPVHPATLCLTRRFQVWRFFQLRTADAGEKLVLFWRGSFSLRRVRLPFVADFFPPRIFYFFFFQRMSAFFPVRISITASSARASRRFFLSFFPRTHLYFRALPLATSPMALLHLRSAVFPLLSSFLLKIGEGGIFLTDCRRYTPLGSCSRPCFLDKTGPAPNLTFPPSRPMVRRELYRSDSTLKIFALSRICFSPF